MKQSLLLVDGDPKSLRVLDVSLKKAGFDVVTATTDREAIERISERTPDLVISDAQTPDVDGFALCRRLKERPEWARVPIVFLTGQKAIDEKIRALELGVEEYLTKPVYIKEITTRVRILLQRQQKERLESRRADTRTKFTGQLSDIGLVDLVQTIELNRKSGIIHLANRDGRRGAIYFRDGRVIDGEAGRLSGAEAVYRSFAWSEGAFEVEFKPIRRRDVIELSPQALLMEGMRRLDEWSRLLEGLPPLEAVFEVDYHVLADRLGEIPDEVNGLLRLFDGRRTFTQVIDDCDFPDLEAVIIIGKLLADGVILQSDDAPSAAPEVEDARAARLARVDRWLSSQDDAEPAWEPEAPAADLPSAINGSAHEHGGDDEDLDHALADLADVVSSEDVEPHAEFAEPPAEFSGQLEERESFEAATVVRSAEEGEAILAAQLAARAAADELAEEPRPLDQTPLISPIARARGRTIRIGYPVAEEPAEADAGGPREHVPTPIMAPPLADPDVRPVEEMMLPRPVVEVVGDLEHEVVPGGTLRGMTAVTDLSDAAHDPAELPTEAPTTRLRGLPPSDDEAAEELLSTSGEIPAEAVAETDAGDLDAEGIADLLRAAGVAPTEQAPAAVADELAAPTEESEPEPASELRLEEFPEGRPGEGGTSLVEEEPRRSVLSLDVVPGESAAAPANDVDAMSRSEMLDEMAVPSWRGKIIAGVAVIAGSALAFALYRGGMFGPGKQAEHAAMPEPPVATAPVSEPAHAPTAPVPPPPLPKVELPAAAAEPAKAEAAKVEPVKAEPAKVEPSKPETAKPAPVAAAAADASFDALVDTCQQAQKRGNAKTIVVECTKVVDAKPKARETAAFMTALAFAESDRDRTGEAMRWARQALAIDPEHADAYQALGVLHQGLGHVGEARAAYKRFLELAPQSPDAAAVRHVLGTLRK